MALTAAQQETLKFVEENDIKFIRLAFCSLRGTMKNVAIMADRLPIAFAQGIRIDAPAVTGNARERNRELVLFPNPETLTILPWRSQQGCRVARFYCDIKTTDGKPYGGDCRALLRDTMMEVAKAGYTCRVNTECEFYLFELDENGHPTKIPHDMAGYMDVAPEDKGENIRREICLTLEDMSIIPESSHHETGPGQNEIDFHAGDAMSACDCLVTFKNVVKAVAERNGLYASFMPKPIGGEAGSGLCIHLGLYRDGEPVPECANFLAGILKRIPELTLFMNPITNSYQRYLLRDTSPYVSWRQNDRFHMASVIYNHNGLMTDLELRAPDPAVNPYLACLLLIRAGLEGIRNQEKLPPATEFSPIFAKPHQLATLPHIPESLREAADLASRSAFLKGILEPEILQNYIDRGIQDSKAYLQADSKEEFEKNRYFYKM